MKKFLIAVLLALNTTAHAQDDISSSDLIGNGRYLGAKTADGQGTVPVLGLDSSGNTQLNAASGKTAVIAVAKTPVSVLDTQGVRAAPSKGLNYAAPYSPVFVSTPVAGTNVINPGYNIVAPTATANTAAGLPAVPTPGDMYVVDNKSASTVRIKAYGTPGINGGASGTYIPLATMARARCIAVSATDYHCDTGVIPTPAGP